WGPREVPLEPSTRAGSWIACDPELSHFALVKSHGDLVVGRLSDGVEVGRLPAEGRNLWNMRFSPDGEWLAILGYKFMEKRRIELLLLWRWRHGMQCQELPSLVWDRAFDFMPDSKSVICSDADGAVHIVDVADCGRPTSIKSGTSRPMHLAVDPAGRQVAISNSRKPEVVICDLTTGEVMHHLAHPMQTGPLAWHPDGNILAVSCADSHSYLWDIASGIKLAAMPSQHGYGANGLTFAAHGNLLMTWAWVGKPRFWNPWTGKQLVTCSGVTASLNRDGSQLVTRRGTKLVRWEVAGGQEYWLLPNPPALNGQGNSYRRLDCGLDQRWFVVGGRDGLRLWDLPLYHLPATLPLGRNLHVAFHPTKSELLCSGAEGMFRLPARLEGDTLFLVPPRKVSSHENNRLFVLDGEGRTIAALTSRGARIWNTAFPEAGNRMLEHPGTTGLALSRDGEWLVTLPWNGQGAKVWRT